MGSFETRSGEFMLHAPWISPNLWFGRFFCAGQQLLMGLGIQWRRFRTRWAIPPFSPSLPEISLPPLLWFGVLFGKKTSTTCVTFSVLSGIQWGKVQVRQSPFLHRDFFGLFSCMLMWVFSLDFLVCEGLFTVEGSLLEVKTHICKSNWSPPSFPNPVWALCFF